MRTCAFPLAHCSPDLLLPSRKSFVFYIRRSIQPQLHYSKFVGTNSRPSLTFRCCSTGHGAAAAAAAGGGEEFSQQQQSQNQQSKGFLKKWKEKSAEMSSKAAKLGMSAVLAYGLFDAVTYTSFFVLAFLGYEKSTGKNPAANIPALVGIVILMWTGNNVTRPFRVGGAAAVAPVVDRGLRKIQNYFNFPSLVYAFGLVVGIVAAVCLTVGGLLILSRWGK